MGIKKKVGIGIVVIIVLFIVLVIYTQVWWANLTPEERQQIDDKREAKELQAKIDAEKLQKEIDEIEKETIPKTYAPNTIGGIPIEPGESYLVSKDGTTKFQKEIEAQEGKLNAEELQTIIAGFESYNKSVKMLLDMCGSVESETDFVLLGLLINESGNDFLENTGNYGAVRNTLVSEGYGEHPVLGPLMNRSVMLVDLMSACMEILAWEFSG